MGSRHVKSISCRLPVSANTLHARQRLDRAPAPASDPSALDAVREELARLEASHAQLLRYAHDLKLAYEAERERRVQAAQTALDLMTLLAALTEESGEATNGLAA
jgi:hypothetical protein